MHHIRPILALAAFLCFPVVASEAPPADPAAKTSPKDAGARGAPPAAKTAKRAPAAMAQPVVVTLPDGTEMMALDERFHHYVVLRLAPDGKIERACVHGLDEAEAFAKGATRTPRAEAK